MPRPDKNKEGAARMAHAAKNPMKTLGRLLKFIFTRYWFIFAIVFVCITLASFSSVAASTMIRDITSAITVQVEAMANGQAADFTEIFNIILTMVGIVALLIIVGNIFSNSVKESANTPGVRLNTGKGSTGAVLILCFTSISAAAIAARS